MRRIGLNTQTLERRVPWLDDDEDRPWEKRDSYSIWNHRVGGVDNDDFDGDDFEEWDGDDTIDDYTSEEGPIWKHLSVESIDRLPFDETPGFLEKPSRGARKRYSGKRRRR